MPPKTTAESRTSVPIPEQRSTHPLILRMISRTGTRPSMELWHELDPARSTTENGASTLQARDIIGRHVSHWPQRSGATRTRRRSTLNHAGMRSRSPSLLRPASCHGNETDIGRNQRSKPAQLLQFTRGEGRDSRNSAHCQRSTGSRFLLSRSRQALASNPGVSRDLRNES